MRIPTVSTQAAAAHQDVCAPRRTAATGARLPEAIADRLAGLLAQDPGLAEAVTAQLPAARLDSARDLAAYVVTDPGRRLDLVG